MTEQKLSFCDEKKFEEYYSNRLLALKQLNGDYKIRMTGNAFVDTGLIAINIILEKLRKKEISPHSLTLTDLLEVYQDGQGSFVNGKDLALRNVLAKSWMMVFGTNNPLTQPGFNKKPGKSKDPCKVKPNDYTFSQYSQQVYRFYLLSFLKSISKTGTSLCQICNDQTSLNLFNIETEISEALGTKKPSKFTGGLSRLWFPILGTIGSEAQALPGYNEQPVVCGKCLFAVQYLPQVSRLLNGKLSLFQTSLSELTKRSISDNLAYFNQSYSINPENKIEILGKGQKESKFYMDLVEKLNLFDDLGYNVGTLSLWLFTNSGQEVNCELLEFPGEVVSYLQRISDDAAWKKQLESFLKQDERVHPNNKFIQKLLTKKEYFGFYKLYENRIPAQSFFETYQREIIGRKKESLVFYKAVSQKIININGYDRINRILQKSDFNELRQVIYQAVIELYASKKLSIEYIFVWIFQEIKNDGYKPFNYYLQEMASRKYQNNLNGYKIRNEIIDFFGLAALRYYNRIKKRSTFSIESAHKNLKQEQITRPKFELEKASLTEQGLTWYKIRKLEQHYRIEYRLNNQVIFLIFKLLVLEKVQNPEDIKIQSLNFFESNEDFETLEEESLLSSRVRFYLYLYLIIRSAEHSLNRAISDLNNQINEVKRSQLSFTKFINKKLNGLLDDNKILESHKLYKVKTLLQKTKKSNDLVDFNEFNISQFNSRMLFQSSKNVSNPNNFSWSAMRNQMATFLCQIRNFPNLELKISEKLYKKLEENK